MVRAVVFFNEANPGTAVDTIGYDPAGNTKTQYDETLCRPSEL